MQKREDNIYSRIGIYGIKNLINGKIYIGKTGMNFGDRWDSHRSLLNSGKHDNLHFLNKLPLNLQFLFHRLILIYSYIIFLACLHYTMS